VLLVLTCAVDWRTWYAEFSVLLPMQNSSKFVLPISTAPAALSRATAVASNGGTYESSTLLPAVVRRPAVHKLSCKAQDRVKRRESATSHCDCQGYEDITVVVALRHAAYSFDYLSGYSRLLLCCDVPFATCPVSACSSSKRRLLLCPVLLPCQAVPCTPYCRRPHLDM
jgi:hypothetical protein